MSSRSEKDAVEDEPALVVRYAQRPVLLIVLGLIVLLPGLSILLLAAFPTVEIQFRLFCLGLSFLLLVPGIFGVIRGTQVLLVKPVIVITPYDIIMPGKLRPGVRTVIPFDSIEAFDVRGEESKAQIVITYNGGRLAYINEWLLPNSDIFDEVWSTIDYLLECEETGEAPTSRRLFCNLCGESSRTEEMQDGVCLACSRLTASDHRRHACWMLAGGATLLVAILGFIVLAIILLPPQLNLRLVGVAAGLVAAAGFGLGLVIKAASVLLTGRATRYF